jgi:hypothetical protein
VKRRNGAILGGDHHGNGKIQDRAPASDLSYDVEDVVIRRVKAAFDAASIVDP